MIDVPLPGFDPVPIDKALVPVVRSSELVPFDDAPIMTDSEHAIDMLDKLADRVVFVLDSKTGGIRAAAYAYGNIRESGRTRKTAGFPDQTELAVREFAIHQSVRKVGGLVQTHAVQFGAVRVSGMTDLQLHASVIPKEGVGLQDHKERYASSRLVGEFVASRASACKVDGLMVRTRDPGVAARLMTDFEGDLSGFAHAGAGSANGQRKAPNFAVLLGRGGSPQKFYMDVTRGLKVGEASISTWVRAHHQDYVGPEVDLSNAVPLKGRQKRR